MRRLVNRCRSWLVTVVVLVVCSLHSAELPTMPERGICAHRGGGASHPENTLPALREAVRLGAHMVEFDLAITRDGTLVLMHDATVNRTTDGEGRVLDLPLADVRKLGAGRRRGGGPGSRADATHLQHGPKARSG